MKADAKRKVVSAGDSLYVVVESVGKGGGNSFLGITRFPPVGDGKRVEVRIGPYGRCAGKWTLKAAREKFESIRAWSRETGRDPRELKRGQNTGLRNLPWVDAEKPEPSNQAEGRGELRQPQSQPHIQPELLEAINLNRCSWHVQSVMALKFLLINFLRACRSPCFRTLFLTRT